MYFVFLFSLMAGMSELLAISAAEQGYSYDESSIVHPIEDSRKRLSAPLGGSYVYDGQRVKTEATPGGLLFTLLFPLLLLPTFPKRSRKANPGCGYDCPLYPTRAVVHYEYDPFGNTIHKSGAYADKNAYRFSTKPVDEATGFYYYGYRFYDPVTGRFINRDPIGVSGGDNLYAFVDNSPVGEIDVLGRIKFRYIGDGFQYVPSAEQQAVWLGVSGEIEESDIKKLGENCWGTLLTRISAYWSVTPYHGYGEIAGWDTAYYRDQFKVGRTDVKTGDHLHSFAGENGNTEMLAFQLVNISIRELVAHHTHPASPHVDAKTKRKILRGWNGSKGSLEIVWDYRLVQGKHDGSFSRPSSDGVRFRYPEAAHKPWSDAQPREWSYGNVQSGSYSMRFSWDSDDPLAGGYSMSPQLEPGPQRFRNGRPERGNPDAEVYK